ncbi:DUF6082 family protein [Streptomyces sp. NPDC048324]|uniref:DUF6082 family protein n=1 Tax=Streptomyces sp. NPDC048324 TaxID=3157205 RepID=UPI0034393472
MAAAVLAALLLSPFVLQDVAGSKGVDWNGLSQIGAAYGFTSAIVSALALAGVAGSLIVQNRQARAEQVQGCEVPLRCQHGGVITAPASGR